MLDIFFISVTRDEIFSSSSLEGTGFCGGYFCTYFKIFLLRFYDALYFISKGLNISVTSGIT